MRDQQYDSIQLTKNKRIKNKFKFSTNGRQHLKYTRGKSLGRYCELVVNALIFRSSGPGSSPGQDIVLRSWAGHLTLTAPLSTQVYKWVLANLMLGVTLR